jgi:hypothetical protein
VDDLLKLAIEGHGGLRRWEQISRFHAVVTVHDLVGESVAFVGLVRFVGVVAFGAWLGVRGEGREGGGWRD